MNTTVAAPGDAMSLLADAFDRHHDNLIAYMARRMRPDDAHQAEDLAQNVWLAALEAADPTDRRADVDSGLPGYVARIARAALRRFHSPTNLEVLLGARADKELLAAAAPPAAIQVLPAPVAVPVAA